MLYLYKFIHINLTILLTCDKAFLIMKFLLRLKVMTTADSFIFNPKIDTDGNRSSCSTFYWLHLV